MRDRQRACCRMIAEASLDDVPAPDVVVVPGGVGTRALTSTRPMLDWIRAAHATSTWTTSVCTGSLLLGAAGVLDGLRGDDALARARDAARLRREPDRAARRRAGQGRHGGGRVGGHRHGARRSPRGSPGDEAAQAIQLGIEYDPQPPFDAGSVEKAAAGRSRTLIRRGREGSARRTPARDGTCGDNVS